MAKKQTAADKHPGQRRYIALTRIASEDGSQVWNPGAEIWLDDLRGQLHLAKGTVMTADETEAPEPAPEPVEIHEPVIDAAQLKELKNGNTDSTATN